MRNKISSWVRQSRHRAKKHGVTSDIKVGDIQAIVDASDGLCAYCDATASTLDHPFPLSNGAPNVPANVLPICRNCKSDKGACDLVDMLNSNKITKKKFIKLLEAMLVHAGADDVRSHIKSITGIGL